jgi:hypothetical protein
MAMGFSHMQVIGQGIVDDVDIGIGQQRLVGAVGAGNAKSFGGRFGLVIVARGNRHDFRAWRLLDCRNDLLHPDIGRR